MKFIEITSGRLRQKTYTKTLRRFIFLPIIGQSRTAAHRRIPENDL